ncbi:MAG: InlB B-repeat-containing protein [Fibrobacterota bacterium]
MICTKVISAIPVTAGSGNMYSAAVSGLTAGANTFVFTATDKAVKPNSDSKTIVVMYDPTATDVTGPVIKLSNPGQDSSKVAQASAKLVVVCKDDNGIAAVNYAFGSLSGAMTKDNDSTYSVALANLVKGNNQITILATDASSKKNANDTVFTIVYDPTLNDNAAPVITLKTPEKDSTKVSSKSITVEVVCTDTSGIDTVTCKVGTTDVAVVKGTGGVYSASMITLAAGTFTFTFTATDKASTKHSSTKSVTVICDPSMIDNVPPTVAIKNPQSADQRVFTDTITVQIDCSDDNNISSVTATRGGAAVSGITNAGSLYSVKVTALTAGKSDTINFKVVDNSSNKVSKDFPVILRYNRKPVAATLGTPADGATGVVKKTVFTWTDGTDPDGDVVTYTLQYGTSETSLNKTVPNLTAKTTTLSTDLSGAVKYYWQVVTNTTVNGDFAVSGIASFTTVEDAPLITAEPATQSVDLGNKATFSVTASGLNLKYQWYKGTAAITGATLPSYTTSAVIATDDGSMYYCAVSNGGGEVKSSTVSLIVKYGVTYNVNNGSGTAPVDNSTYAKGESATVKAETGISRDKYTFGGWGRSATGNTKVYNATDTLKIGTGSVTLYAQWNLIPTYTLTYSANGGGGNPPSPVTGLLAGANVTVASSGTLSRTGYVFSGWNTNNDGSGTNYIAGTGTFLMSAKDLTLYAKWTPETFAITYLIDNLSYSGTPSSYNIETATFNLPVPTKTGYAFSGWYGASDLSGSKITSVVKGSNGDKTFYAKWLTLYTVTYDANGGGANGSHGSGTVPVDSKGYAAGSTVTVYGNSGNLTKTAYSFDGWSRTKTYDINDQPVASFTMGSNNEILYARWVIKDASGNKYHEVTVGTGVWILENLRTAKYNDGSDIPLAGGGNFSVASFYPGDQTYGAFYNGHAVARDTDRMLAPPGWHVMKSVEAAELQYAAVYAKELASKEYWKTGSLTDNVPGQQPSLNNLAKFNAIPAGYFWTLERERGENAYIWINNFYTDENGIVIGTILKLNWDSSNIGFSSGTDASVYYSVRCKRDY